MNEAYLKSLYDMLYLVKKAIHKEEADESLFNNESLKKAYELSLKHSLSALTYSAVSSFKSVDKELLNNWKLSKDRSTRKIIMMDIERTKLFDYLTKNKVFHLPLKGIIIKDLYPFVGAREMADNDIYFDRNYQELVRDYFVQNEYSVEAFDRHVHDTYHKKPFYNFEMHTSLFDKHTSKAFKEYYDRLNDKLIKDSSNEYSCSLSDEDFYIYITCHEYKHFKSGGTGLRSLLDTYVYNSSKPNLNYDYLEEEFNKLEISKHEKDVRNLALKVFSNTNYDSKENLEIEEIYLLEYFLTSGTYGTLERSVENGLKKNKNGKITFFSKVRFFFSRVFLPYDVMCHVFPVLKKAPILLPFMWVWRIIKALFTKFGKVVHEIKIVNKAK